MGTYFNVLSDGMWHTVPSFPIATIHYVVQTSA